MDDLINSYSAPEYGYDNNGSLTYDANKGVSWINYDQWGNPIRVQFTDHSITEHVYTADGRRLKTIHRTSIPQSNPLGIGVTVSLTPAQTQSIDSLDYVGNFIYEKGQLKRYMFDDGYLKLYTNTFSPRFFIKDHLGNNRIVTDGSGNIQQNTNYYPYGGMTSISTGQGEQQFKYNGKEYDPMHGLNEYDYGARQYDPARGQFTTMDPLCEKYYHISPYAYCGGNPVNAVDPDGRSTWVMRIDNYHYRVVGGDLYDKDLGIYVGDFDESHTFIRKEYLGQTTSMTSFYNSDANDKNGTWMDCIIEITDRSGIDFLSFIIEQNPPLLDYMLNAQNGCILDFKVTNGTRMNYSEDKFYRGMPTGIIDENGNIVYSSARDIGNIAAGYIAAANHIGWDAARKAFDLYQGEPEGVSTKNAQLYGWNMGNTTISNIRKTYNLIRSSAPILKVLIPFF